MLKNIILMYFLTKQYFKKQPLPQFQRQLKCLFDNVVRCS